MKTEKEVQTDVIALLQGSGLASGVSGGIYRYGQRPRDSRSEDVIVEVETGFPGEIQTGIIVVRVYVADIAEAGTGVMREDSRRCGVLEALADAWVDTLTAGVTNYLFSRQNMVCTVEEPDINQHFVVVKLKYKYYSFSG